MNAKEVKAAANLALSRYLEKGRDETSTRDYTAVVYPDLQSVVVQWAAPTKKDVDNVKYRTFEITIGKIK